MAKDINIKQTSKKRTVHRNLQTSSSGTRPTSNENEHFRSEETSLPPTTDGSTQRPENVKTNENFDTKYHTLNSSNSENSSVRRNETSSLRDMINDSLVIGFENPVGCKRALSTPTCRYRRNVSTLETSNLSGATSSNRCSCNVKRVIRNTPEEFPINPSLWTNVNRSYGGNRPFESSLFTGSFGALTGGRNSRVLTHVGTTESYDGTINNQPNYSNRIPSAFRVNDISSNTGSCTVKTFSIPRLPRSNNSSVCPGRLGPDGRKDSQRFPINPSLYTNVNRTYGEHRSRESCVVSGSSSALAGGRNYQALTNIGATNSCDGTLNNQSSFPTRIPSELRVNDTSSNTTSLTLKTPRVPQLPRSNNSSIFPGGLGVDGRSSSQTLEMLSGPATTRTPEEENLYGGNALNRAIAMLSATSILLQRKLLGLSAPYSRFRSPSISGALPQATDISSLPGLINTTVYNPINKDPPFYEVTGNANPMEDSGTHNDEPTSDNEIKEKNKKKNATQNITPKSSLKITTLGTSIRSNDTSLSTSRKTPNISQKSLAVAEPEVETTEYAYVADTFDGDSTNVDTEIEIMHGIPDVNAFPEGNVSSGEIKASGIVKSPEQLEKQITVEDSAIKSRCTKMTIRADIPASSRASPTDGLFVFAEMSQSPSTSQTTGTFIVNRGNKCASPVVKETSLKEQSCIPKTRASRMPEDQREIETPRSITRSNSTKMHDHGTLDSSQNQKVNGSSIIFDKKGEETKITEMLANDKVSKETRNPENTVIKTNQTTGVTVIMQSTGNAQISLTCGSPEFSKTFRDKCEPRRATASEIPALPVRSATVGPSEKAADFRESNKCFPEVPGKPREFKIDKLNEMPVSPSSQADNKLKNTKLSDVSKINEIKRRTDTNNILSMCETVGLPLDIKKCSGKQTSFDARIHEKVTKHREKCRPGGLCETVNTVSERIRNRGLESKVDGRYQTSRSSRAAETLADRKAHEQTSRQGARSKTKKPQRSSKPLQSALRHTARHCGGSIISEACNPQRICNAIGMLEAAGNARYGTCFEGVARQLIATRDRTQRATRRPSSTRGVKIPPKEAAEAVGPTTMSRTRPRDVYSLETSVSSELIYQLLYSESDFVSRRSKPSDTSEEDDNVTKTSN